MKLTFMAAPRCSAQMEEYSRWPGEGRTPSPLLSVEDDAENDCFDGPQFFLGDRPLTLGDKGL